MLGAALKENFRGLSLRMGAREEQEACVCVWAAGLGSGSAPGPAGLLGETWSASHSCWAGHPGPAVAADGPQGLLADADVSWWVFVHQ